MAIVMDETSTFTLQIEQLHDFEFRVGFDSPDATKLLLDEPPPLGSSAGPNAARLVAAAVANCLSSSLLFCMRKFKHTPGMLRAAVTGELLRNDQGRMRLGRFDVTIHLAEPAADIGHFERCVQQFEDFCIVTESIRRGVPVGVRIVDGTGKQVFASHQAANAS